MLLRHRHSATACLAYDFSRLPCKTRCWPVAAVVFFGYKETTLALPVSCCYWKLSSEIAFSLHTVVVAVYVRIQGLEELDSVVGNFFETGGSRFQGWSCFVVGARVSGFNSGGAANGLNR